MDLGVWLGEGLLHLSLWPSSSSTWGNERPLEWGVSLVRGEVDEGILNRFVLQVDGWGSTHDGNLIHLGIVGLLGFLEQNVDKGSATGFGLEASLDEFLDLVVGNLDVHNLLLSLGSLEPEDVFGSEGDGVGVDTFTDKLEPSGGHFLSPALYLKVSSLTTSGGAEALLGKVPLAKGVGGALEL